MFGLLGMLYAIWDLFFISFNELTIFQILSLVHGGGYHHFDPGWEGRTAKDEDYGLTVLRRMYNAVGPFPPSLADLLDPEAFQIVLFLNRQGPPQKPLQRWTTKEIPAVDNEFIRRILKLDPRERPNVEEIMQDEWFTEQSEDTREPESKKPCVKSNQ